MELGDDLFVTNADQHPAFDLAGKQTGWVFYVTIRHKRGEIEDFRAKVPARDQDHLKQILGAKWFRDQMTKFAQDQGIRLSPEDQAEQIELMKRQAFNLKMKEKGVPPS